MEVRSGDLPEGAGPLLPEILGVELPGLELDHSVILGDQVEPPARARDARELAQDSARVGDRLQDVAADHQVEGAVGKAELGLTRIRISSVALTTASPVELPVSPIALPK